MHLEQISKTNNHSVFDMAIFGLFVGVNKYANPRVSTLYGCTNDVELINRTLQARYKIPDSNIRILLNTDATKQAVIEGFQQHLSQAGADDTVLFYFSGQGSQEKADSGPKATGASRYNETVVCHDSRAAEPYDLADKEIRYLIYQLSKRGIKVVTILDTCHSGDATRVLESDNDVEIIRRQSPNENGARPLDSYLFSNDPEMQDWTDDFPLSMPEGSHIALGACHDEELAKERHFNRRRHGAFTYALCHKLKYERDTPSYRNLVDAVKQLLNGLVDYQTPQLQVIGERDPNEEFLGTQLQAVEYQVSNEGHHWVLNAGISQGINNRARLQIGTGDLAVDVIVTEAQADKSLLRIAGQGTLNKGIYAAVMVDAAQPKLPVKLVGADQSLASIRNLISQAPYSYDLEEAEVSDYTIEADEKGLSFSRSPLPINVPALEKHEATHALDLTRHMAEWERIRKLNYSIGDIPDDLVELIIERYDHETQSFIELNASRSVAELAYTKVDGTYQKPEVRIKLRLNEKHDVSHDVYVSLLLLDPIEGKVSNLFKRTGGEVLRQYERTGDDGQTKRAKTEIYFTKNSGRREITFSLPEILINKSINRVSDYFKLFVSSQPLDISRWVQQQTKSLEDLLNNMRSKGTTRSSTLDDDTAYYQARTQTIAVDIYHPEIGEDETQGKGIDNDPLIPNQAPTSPTITRSGGSEAITFSALAPSSLLPGGSYFVDIWAHLPSQVNAVIDAAKLQGQIEVNAGSKPGVFFPVGTVLSVSLNVPGLTVDEPAEIIDWNGEPTNASFIVSVPHDVKVLGKRPGKASIYIDGIKIASVTLLLNVGYETKPLPAKVGKTHYPKSAFASYARKNKDEVFARMQGIQTVAKNLEIFVDVLTLRAGDRWQDELCKNIQNRDVFYLFWSQQAATSEWVTKEWQLALKLRGLDYIQPVPLEEPRIAPPPAELAELHFNDPWLAYLKAGI